MIKFNGYANLQDEKDRNTQYFAQEALSGFDAALTKNFWQHLAGLLFGQPDQLLVYDQIRWRIPFEGQYDAGEQEIPVDQIAGSVGRAQDFSAGFLPRKADIRYRWVKIAKANLLGEYLPPIEVFQVGQVYFVQDGNHRVSVARALGQATISAHVIVVRVPEELSGQANLESAAMLYERDRFFQCTRLREIRPEAQVAPTLPGFYQKIQEHITTHRWFMGQERKARVSWEDAVADWYDAVYQPVAQAIRDHHLLAAFPGRSEADLYLWISEYAWYRNQAGAPVAVEKAALTFAESSSSGLPRLLWRLYTRLPATR